MKIVVLGSAAGGGFPQWNCNCPNCTGLPLVPVLSHYCTVERHALPINTEAASRAMQLPGMDGIGFTPLALKSKAPPYSPHRALPQSGDGGMITVLDAIGARRKIFIHINNTNPILDDHSAERATLTRHGIEVAFDGMEISL